MLFININIILYSFKIILKKLKNKISTILMYLYKCKENMVDNTTDDILIVNDTLEYLKGDICIIKVEYICTLLDLSLENKY